MMNKKMKLGILGLVLALGMTGCGMSKKQMNEAKEVVNKMVEASENCAVTGMDCETRLVTKMKGGIVSEDWEITLDTTSQYDRENFMSLSESTITNFYNDNSEMYVKSYMIVEEDKLNTYRLVDGYDWFKHDSKIKVEDISRNLVDGPNWEKVEILGLDEDTHMIEGRENHKLTVRLTGEGTRDFIFESGLRNLYWNVEYGTLDLQDVEMKVDYYVDCENYRVSKMVIDFEEMESVIKRHEELSYANAIDVEFKECSMVYDNINYEPVKVPKMSFEDKKDCKEVLQADEVISIEERDNVAQVKCYKRWTIVDRDYDVVALTNPAGSKYVSYIMGVNSPVKEWRIGVEKRQIPDMQESGIYVSHEKGTAVDGFEVYYIKFTDGMCAYAWGQVGEEDECVSIYVEQVDTDNIEEFLKEAINNITW